jgi:pimeloyl-ACP methyl ester carboxylesterase
MTTESEKHFVDVSGVRTCYLDEGHGDVVLLLHSVDPGCSGFLEYRKNIAQLSKRFRVVAPDLIGFGGTDMPKPPIKEMSRAYTDHIVSFMDALGISRAHLVGNSRGGLISIAIAAASPQRVGRIVLLGNAGGGVTLEYAEKQRALYANFRPSREALRGFIGDSFFSLDRDVPQDIFEIYFANAQKQFARYDAFGPLPTDVPDLRRELNALSNPVLFMFGKEDKRWPPPHEGLDVFLATPGSCYLMLSECGHHPQTEHPAYFDLIAPAFLSGELP